MIRIKRWWRGQGEWTRFGITLVGGVSLFYLVEDTRGYLALSAAKKPFREEGFRLSPEEYVRNDLPHEDNFAASELIRGAYEGRQEFLPEGDLPDPQRQFLKERNPHGFHGSDEVLEDYGEPGQPRAEVISYLKETLSRVETAMWEWQETVSRPECDWTVVTTPTEVDQHPVHLSLFPGVQRVFVAKARLAFAENDSASAAEAVSTLLRGSGMLMIEQTLIGYAIGALHVRMAISEVATGLECQIWNVEELESIGKELREIQQRLDRKAMFEVEAAMVATSSKNLWKQRKMYDVSASTFGLKVLDLPDNLIWIETDYLESVINKSVYLIPRGWFWLSQAEYLRFMASSQKDSAMLQKYPFSGSFFQPLDLDGLVDKIEETESLVELAIQACELETFTLENQSYPSIKEFREITRGIGYRIGENGRPILWSREEGEDVNFELKSEDFETRREMSLWLYP